MTAGTATNVRLLKGIVILLGIAIVVVLSVIVITIIQRAGQMAEGEAPAVGAAPAAETTTQSFGDLSIAIPVGAEVVGMVMSGDRMVLRLARDGAADALLVVDLSTGRRLGRITLDPQPR